MPTAPPRLCPTPGCPGLWDGKRCTVCNRKPKAQRRNAPRGPHRAQQKKWYDSARWRKAKAHFFADPEHALCAMCGRPAETIDHVIPPKGNPKLFWDRNNWQPSCLECNRIKGAAE